MYVQPILILFILFPFSSFEMPLPLSSRSFFLWSVIYTLLLFLSTQTLQAEAETVLVSPISKDKSTNLFALSVFIKTPLRHTKLYLDLGFPFPWTLCNANYNSSSFHTIPCDATFCDKVGFGALSCTNCTNLDLTDPNCIPENFVCGSFPENPVTRASIADSALVDTLALPTSQGPLAILTNYTFSCSDSTLLKGLPKKVTGLVTLGRSKLSLMAQINAQFSSPLIFALCFPSSSKASGVAFFGSSGPYNTISKIDLSKSLIYTPLLINPIGLGDTLINYREGTPSSYYYIALTSIKVNAKHVPINKSLLTINNTDDFGSGGTKISTNTSYTILESSILKAFTDLFVKEASSSAFNLTITSPVKPFKVCYPAGDLTVTSAGPLVPTVDLVLHAKDVVWRIVGANSMVRVTNKNKGVDLWCLSFVDGGVNIKTPIVIGGKQLEDNMFQFDLQKNRFGFTNSLLSRSLSCADFNVTDFVGRK